MKFILKNRMIFFYFLAVVAVAVLMFISHSNTQKVKSTSNLVERTQEVLRKSDDVLLDALNIETGLRGFILTGDELFLRPFYAGVATMKSNLEAFAVLTRGNPSQQLRIIELKKVADERIVLVNKLIETKRQSRLNETEAIEGTTNGRVLTDKIRGIIDLINMEEFRLLKQSKIENDLSNRNAELLFLSLIVFVIVIFALVFKLIKNQEVREKITEELKHSILIAERATVKAEESAKLKEAFLANMSHEIRTPMNAIIGFSDILFKGKLGEKEKEYVRTIKMAGGNLLTIINDILDISKIEAGMMTFEEHPFSVKEIFKSLSVMLMGKAKEKNIELVFDCDEGVPDSLLGDPTRLTQIIINLTGNAIKFTERGGRINVFAKVLKKNESIFVEFSVKDTGIGIPPDKLEHIFERFRQAESHTTRKYGGTGLGLSIAKQLVDLQGGTLSVKSEFKVGSVFSFFIPYKKSEEIFPKPEITGEKYNMKELSKLNILLVEDNQLNVKLILSLFSENNLKVQVAENGSVGIEKLKSTNFDIILMDMEMPVMNGYEAATIIRKELKNNIPIISMTAHAMAGERERCLSLGMNDYISKPINANLLFEKIYNLTFNS